MACISHRDSHNQKRLFLKFAESFAEDVALFSRNNHNSLAATAPGAPGLLNPAVAFTACLVTLALLSPTAAHAQAAFPTATGTMSHVFPTDAADATPQAQDEDNVDVRDRTPEDDARIEREAAAKAAKAAKNQPLTAPDAPVSVPDAPLVKDVEIVGASSEDAARAMQVLTTHKGEPLNPDKQRKDISKLYDLGLFQANISVEAVDVPGGVTVRYIVQANPKVTAVNVTGNMKVPTAKIIGDMPVKAGETYTVQAQNKVRDNIIRLYEERGFPDAAVTVEERPDISGNVELNVHVDEGTKTKIRNLQIVGANSMNDLMLKLKTENRGSWGPFKRYYNESKFEHDMDVVRAAYLNKGFLDVDVRRGDFVYAEDRSWVDPVIVVNEGPQYQVGRLEGSGYTIFSRDEVLAPFRSLQGKVYDQAEFDKRAKQVTNMYGDEGFVSAVVAPEFHKDPSTGLVDVDINVTEGSRVYVGDVRVVSETYPEDTEMGWLRRFYSRFSPPVKDEVVRREVQLRPGQVYRRFDEVRTRERLQSLNVFEDVQVHEQLTGDSNVRDLVVQVEQGNTGSLIFGAGFGDVEGGFVYANYIEHNLFGLARDLRVSLLMGTRAASGEITYLDRYFMGTDIDAQFSAFHKMFRRTGNIDQTNTGLTAEFTRPLSDCIKDSVRLRVESIGFDFDNHRPHTKIEDYVAATIRYRMQQDTRDDLFFPTEGHVATGSVETGVANSFLLKLEGQYASYFQVADDWVAANNTMVSLIPTNIDDLGYADRLFMGGSGDLRGFRVSGAGPHDSRNESVPTGGATKLITQFELRRRFTENFAGLAFADIGMLGHNPLEVESPRASVGVGVRMRLPIASVSLDLGVPVISKKEDQTQILHFNMTSAW